MTAEIKTFIPPNICSVPGCGKSTDDYHYFICDEHMPDARIPRRKYLDRLHRRTPPGAFLLMPERPDSGVTHEVVLHITPEMRERYAARHRKPLIGEERRGTECGELYLAELS